MEAVCTSETPVKYQTIWRHIPQHIAVTFMAILQLNIRWETNKQTNAIAFSQQGN
jgi:hypothetical protein